MGRSAPGRRRGRPGRRSAPSERAQHRAAPAPDGRAECLCPTRAATSPLPAKAAMPREGPPRPSPGAAPPGPAARACRLASSGARRRSPSRALSRTVLATMFSSSMGPRAPPPPAGSAPRARPAPAAPRRRRRAPPPAPRPANACPRSSRAALPLVCPFRKLRPLRSATALQLAPRSAAGGAEPE